MRARTMPTASLRVESVAENAKNSACSCCAFRFETMNDARTDLPHP